MYQNLLSQKQHTPITVAQKKLRFDIKKFQKFKDKIVYIVVDQQPDNILELN